MTQAAALLAAGQRFMADQFPAVINIGGQSYQAATTGFHNEERPVDGGSIQVNAITFWLASDAFDTAGQPKATPGQQLQYAGKTIVIDILIHPPGAGTLTLKCVERG